MSNSVHKMNSNIPRRATTPRRTRLAACLATAFAAASLSWSAAAQIPSTAPSVVDPNLAVTKVAFQLQQPTSMAFIGPNDILVTEKASGRVKRVVNNVLQATPVLDLAVNSASERGLLHMALHPNFPGNPRVYLYWTQSSTGADSAALADVPLLGNRVDSFLWNGSTLTLERSIIALRSFQADTGQPLRGNHNGGVISFGPDGKLYIVIGDNGRRGWMQNLPCGPTAVCPGPTVQDDQFGGPAPDNAHLTGVLLRLNDDGSTPTDNPFFAVGAAMPGEVGANIQKIFAYGVRNTFGFAFDPVSGALWLEENGDDSFSQLARVPPGLNSGWVQMRGPASRLAQYKAIETSTATDPCIGGSYLGLQQNRWSPTNIADTAADAQARLFMLPGAFHKDPELSWKYEVAPAAVGFLSSNALGTDYANNMFMGGARNLLQGGHLFRFKLNATRTNFVFDDPRLADGVADNVCKFDITESESLLFGRNFGVVTDIKTGPDGNLYILSLSNGLIYKIFRRS